MRITRKTLREMADENGYLYKKGQRKPKLRIFEDGTIIRADTDLTLCNAMTVSEALKVLDIKN